MGDIGNEYLNANTEEKIYTCAGAKFELVGIMEVDLRIKYRLVIGGQVVYLYRKEVYASTTKSVSSRILMKIAAANKLEVMMGDIGNAYLNANTEEKIYTCAGAKFELVGIMDEGNFLEVVKALYGLPTIVNMWNAYLSHNLRAMSFKPTHFDPCVWVRGPKGGCYYIGTCIDDFLVVSVDPTSIFNKLKETYTIKVFGLLKVNLSHY